MLLCVCVYTRHTRNTFEMTQTVVRSQIAQYGYVAMYKCHQHTRSGIVRSKQRVAAAQQRCMCYVIEYDISQQNHVIASVPSLRHGAVGPSCRNGVERCYQFVSAGTKSRATAPPVAVAAPLVAAHANALASRSGEVGVGVHVHLHGNV